jgi:hypothetical protein
MMEVRKGQRMGEGTFAGAPGNDENGQNRPFSYRDDIGRLHPLPVVRRSAGPSFATDSCFRLTEEERHSVSRTWFAAGIRW